MNPWPTKLVEAAGLSSLTDYARLSDVQLVIQAGPIGAVVLGPSRLTEDMGPELFIGKLTLKSLLSTPADQSHGMTTVIGGESMSLTCCVPR